MPLGRSGARAHDHRERGVFTSAVGWAAGWAFRSRDFTHSEKRLQRGIAVTDKTELPPEAEKILEDIEKQETPELTSDVVINLAGLTPLQYAQQLQREAKKYGTTARLLDQAVVAARIEQEAEKLLEPHWEVSPAEEPVDAVSLFPEIETRILQHVVM